MKKLVSFIIPAYNAADTIVRCLDSIRNLTLNKEDYEINVIDDASTDDTVSVIGNWKLENGDCRLEILQQPENRRQGAARNRGVRVAKGEYICFVDADDAVTEGIVKAIRTAAENKTDMTAYHYAFVNEQGIATKEADKLSFEEGQIFSGIEMQNKHPYWCSGPVAYIYNRAFLKQVSYPFVEGVLFEDADFVAVHLYHANRMTYSAELGYTAYEREGSTTRHTSYKNVADYLLLGERMLRFYERIKNEGVKESCLEGAKNELTNEGVNERERFAEKILEGACYNVAKSCKWLIRLESAKEVQAYYERVDEFVNRNDIFNNQSLHAYYWTLWTSLCIKHEQLAKMALVVLRPIYKFVKG